MKKKKEPKLPKNWGKMADGSMFGQLEKIDLKKAYQMVIKDLSGGLKCKDHALGCFQCATQKLAEELEFILELGFGDEK